MHLIKPVHLVEYLASDRGCHAGLWPPVPPTPAPDLPGILLVVVHVLDSLALHDRLGAVLDQLDEILMWHEVELLAGKEQLLH